MKTLVFVITAALAVLAGIKLFQSKTQNSPTFTRFLAGPNLSQLKNDSWSAWKMSHNKSYFTNFEEDFRQKIFEDNLSVVIKHNASEDKTYTMAVNHLSDLTDEEFKKHFTGLNFQKKAKKLRFSFFGESKREDLPKRVDWREQNAVTDVEDQGSCGSCYTFSTTGAIEGIYAIKNKKLVKFSQQQLVDCTNTYGNDGCEGGVMDNAFRYIIDHGLQTRKDYPYKNQAGTCKYDKSKDSAKLTKFVDVPVDDSYELAKAVAQQPVSVGIDSHYIKQYRSGVFSDYNCKENLNHAVLVVGYGTENGQDYWLVKNTWGKSWGEDGFFKLAKKDSGPGICGVTVMPSYPVLDEENLP